ncbi:MAG: AAA family ATPase, partial [Syntrophorhabdaceae bacterium]|nr:AAA family ATPase [Syntrophorhabdaceae bacterium]
IPYAQGKKFFPIELNELGTGLATRTYKGDYGDGEWISGKSRFYNKEQLYNIYRGLPGVPLGGNDNYRKAIVQYMKDNLGLRPFVYSESGSSSPFVFIIDEINRGEISKIFGELFFALDPGYRGKAGEVSTQYANLHENPEEKFFIPDNIYIIGTMNDIDRSVDSFDFAMRRRFRFIEIKASERLEMLDGLEEKDEAIRRINSLNEVIADVEELNENYHIGASYFLKLKTLTFEQLWTDYLAPLLQDYIRGMYDEKGILEKFKEAYEKAGASKDDDNDG